MRAAEDLRKSGAHFGAISVLGAHNAHLLADAYDWVAEFAEGWRILPAFEGGPEENMASLRLPEDEVVRVFLELFRRRANAKKHIRIAPLDDHIKWATLKIAGRRQALDAAQDTLDNIFVVNVNGDVFTRPFAYAPQFRLGNICDASMIDMIAGPAYRSCQGAITRRKIANCANCESAGFCDTSPMHEHGAVEADGERCVVTRGAVRAIESEFRDAGVDSAVIASWAHDHLALQASGV
jgi:radical SAM protein with 4Fe4S-binding SPASM domain